MREKVGDEMLVEILTDSPDQLSFPTAIEAELGFPAFEMIDQQFAAASDAGQCRS